MKKMVVLLVVVVLLIAAIFAGYKLIRRQILDGPGMEYDPKNYPDEEPIDGLNKEAILDGPDGTSTHAFTGSKDSAEVDLLDIEQMPKTAVRQPDAYFQYAIYINVDKPASGEGEMDDIRSVWLANERSGTVIKVCVTNPMAELQWERMKGRGPCLLQAMSVRSSLRGVPMVGTCGLISLTLMLVRPFSCLLQMVWSVSTKKRRKS